MITLTIEPEFQQFPDLKLGLLQGNISNTFLDSLLWQEINQKAEAIRKAQQFDTIKDIPVIQATRSAYRKLGKDPNRYRPSAEALMRRLVKGNEIYQINTMVDIINFLSLSTGYSIGGFDVDQIQGDLTLGIGQPDEPYEAIGRGQLNIESLPVFRDHLGGIGTPTSDVVRTSISENTKVVLLVFNGYHGGEDLKEVLGMAMDLMQRFVAGRNMVSNIYSPM